MLLVSGNLLKTTWLLCYNHKPVKPEDFKRINGLQEIYKGLLRKYQASEKAKTNELVNSEIE